MNGNPFLNNIRTYVGNNRKVGDPFSCTFRRGVTVEAMSNCRVMIT